MPFIDYDNLRGPSILVDSQGAGFFEPRTGAQSYDNSDFARNAEEKFAAIVELSAAAENMKNDEHCWEREEVSSSAQLAQ